MYICIYVYVYVYTYIYIVYCILYICVYNMHIRYVSACTCIACSTAWSCTLLTVLYYVLLYYSMLYTCLYACMHACMQLLAYVYTDAHVLNCLHILHMLFRALIVLYTSAFCFVVCSCALVLYPAYGTMFLELHIAMHALQGEFCVRDFLSAWCVCVRL